MIDWQKPANQIETFDLTEGNVSYEDFVSRYRDSNNYRGNLTWNELAAKEIDFDRLGLSPDTIEEQLATIDRRSSELEDGTFFSKTKKQFVYGETRDDYLTGGFGREGLFSYGGKDTLEGNSGDDIYFVDVETSNGSKIYDTDGQDYLIIADSEDLQNLSDDLFFDPVMETESVAVHRFYNQDSGTHLYTIDENEKNIVRQELDNYNYEGEVFSAYSLQVEGSIPIYRFYNSATGSHFYTPSATERDVVIDELPNFESEGIAYYALSVDSNGI